MLFPIIGYQVTKPDVIFKLEQREEPWVIEEEMFGRHCPGELSVKAAPNEKAT